MERSAKKIVAVVLAAGQSKRMGEAKLLLPFPPQVGVDKARSLEKRFTILDQTLLNLKGANIDQILLVSGGYRSEVEAVAKRQSVPSFYNRHYATGEMLSSLQVAVRHLLGDSAADFERRGMMVFLGDMPFIKIETINFLIDQFQTGRSSIEVLIPTFDGRQGHPVIFDSSLFEPLLALEPGQAPRDLIKARSSMMVVHKVAVSDDAILFDIDTPEAYAAATDRWNKQTNRDHP